MHLLSQKKLTFTTYLPYSSAFLPLIVISYSHNICLSLASVAAISSSVVGVLLGCVTASVSRERTNSVSDGERLTGLAWSPVACDSRYFPKPNEITR